MEVKGSSIANKLLGDGSPEMDELVFFELVNLRLIQKFVKFANRARLDDFGLVGDGDSWAEYMREQFREEEGDTLSEKILQRGGLDQETIEQRKARFIDQLIEEHRDKSFDEMLYLLT
jgi:hypothetical protein